MKKKAALKMVVDLAMTILFLGQMGYHMMDNRMHEWTGVTLLILFVLHHALNVSWHRTLTRGQLYTAAHFDDSHQCAVDGGHADRCGQCRPRFPKCF